MRIIINNSVYIKKEKNTNYGDDFITDNDDYCLGLSGIILNQYNKEDILKALVSGNSQKRFKGSYVMWLYDKRSGMLYVSNDLLSKQYVYYYEDNGLILINTSFFSLCSDLRDNGRTPHINYNAVRSFLDERIFEDNITYEENTFFLTAYSYLVVDCNKKALEVRSVRIPSIMDTKGLSEQEIIKEMDMRFSEACKLQWKKNEQSGKSQVITISGGMDSRAVVLRMIRQNTGIKPRTFTYAQSRSRDAKISRKTTKRLGLENTFIPLDKCEFVYLKDEIIDANEGQMYYLGSTGAILMAKLLKDDRNVGIVHTGFGGGEILGDICIDGGDSEICKGQNEIPINQKRNLGDIRRCLNFQKTTSHYFFAMSPFLDEDFFEYVMCIPFEMRKGRKIYIDWYKQCMNSAFPSRQNYSRIAKAIERRRLLLLDKLGIRNRGDMNPIQYWYEAVPHVREFLEQSWQHDIEQLKDEKDLVHMLNQSFDSGVVQKFSVLTVSGAVLRMKGLNSSGTSGEKNS